MNEPHLLVSNTGCEVDAAAIVAPKMMRSCDMISIKPERPNGARHRHRLPSSLNKKHSRCRLQRRPPGRLHPEIRYCILVGRAWRPSCRPCRPGSLASSQLCEHAFHWLRTSCAPLDKPCGGAVPSLVCTMASQQGCVLWPQTRQGCIRRLLPSAKQPRTARKTTAADRCGFTAPNNLPGKKCFKLLPTDLRADDLGTQIAVQQHGSKFKYCNHMIPSSHQAPTLMSRRVAQSGRGFSPLHILLGSCMTW